MSVLLPFHHLPTYPPHRHHRATCGPRLSLPFLNLLIYELGQTHGDLQGALAAFRAILRTPGLGRPNTISYNSLLSALVRDVNATVPALLAGEGDGAGSVDEEDEEEELVVVGAEAAAADIVAVAPEMGDVPVAAVLGGGGQQGAQDGLALLDALGGKPVLEAALAGALEGFRWRMCGLHALLIRV